MFAVGWLMEDQGPIGAGEALSIGEIAMWPKKDGLGLRDR
ncbi:hypothetical protein V7x_10620 [Crateriforma conspicua]|uniref:Uncharacterized protein n=1 Tax=Crateriforma conspicua TaxID=2527996 RepID=A0A5C6FT99_9PLAN|nr:hypothetical protein Mal65_42760 [Crateriforma conspicua]TWT70504.1 hypothetical protein Pan14r_28100 [Crateriforma conspicua]TWU65514.1 hypothetical protein V7x_10620 [Crateriforma conspicua]